MFFVRIWTPAHNGAASLNQDRTLAFGYLEGPFATRQEAERAADELRRTTGALSQMRFTEVASRSALERRWGRALVRAAVEELEARRESQRQLRELYS